MNNNYIEEWKIKKLVKRLEEARGNGTSLISLVIPPNTQLCLINKLLNDEYGTATNIKSRVNRLSVLDAITSAQQKLKLYNKCPQNGLLLYCGIILTDEGKEKRVTIDFEPPKPINTSLYKCDNKFHVTFVNDLIESVDSFGFIIINGDGCLFASLEGNKKNIISEISVELPKKHKRGGQSALRFARLRIEARNNYITKVSELCNQFYITDNKCNVKGFIFAGFADFKLELQKSETLDYRLKDKILSLIDVSYGGKQGLNQAIALSSEVIGNIRIYYEKNLLEKFFKEIELDSGKYCFGITDTYYALELGAVEKIIVYEELQLKCNVSEDNKLTETNVNEMNFTEWIANNYHNYGTELEFISDCTTESNQFIMGFSGLGAILRWKVEFDLENN